MTRCPDCAALETRVAELERRLDELATKAVSATCERCHYKRLITRCAGCMRDLCRQCAAETNCPNGFVEHRA
jgi:hypothetical protein